ncbi:MAG: hypothetical protein A3G24_28625 [Betaproteobacteria bacterium RIFCSPLOWO2_12_FULL_62_13]|nr:MAG: hypothetical protein A3G24_28625 [Betaproteobacteria bacterium RIFCSPLOWO2_12_FULL_62_13]
MAQALSELGIGRGDRVAIWLPNIPLWVVSLFACAQLGAIVLAVNTRFRSSELSDTLGRAEAKALIFWPSFRGIGFTEVLHQICRRTAALRRAAFRSRRTRGSA